MLTLQEMLHLRVQNNTVYSTTNNNQDNYSSCLIFSQKKTVWALLINSSQECKADDHKDNDDSNSNANRHVSQSSGFHTQLTGCDHVSTVNGISSL